MAHSTLTKVHLRRLREIYRSAGWPYLDTIEVDLLAAGFLERVLNTYGADSLRLTNDGIVALAGSMQRNRAAFDEHEALVERAAIEMHRAGRIVWTRVAARALIGKQDDKNLWRVAMPDVYSIRNSSKEEMVEPIVHEIKVRRADLLSDLRNEEKRAAYLALSHQAYYVLAPEIGTPDEIPPEFGVIIQDGTQLRSARFAPKRACTTTFATWMVLAKSAPRVYEADEQSLLAPADEEIAASRAQSAPQV